MYQLLVGDWDGTLCDTGPGIVKVKRDAGANLRLPAEQIDVWVSMAQFSILQQMHRLFPDDAEAQKRLEAEYLRLYGERVKDISPLFPGVMEVAQELAKHQRQFGIATNKNAEFVNIALQHQGMAPYINPVIGCYDVKQGKPAPDCILRVLELLSVSKDKAVMLGDAVQDMIAAGAAGIDGIGISTGVSSRRELEDAGALIVVDDIRDILPLFLPK